jgi:hypothetical protein
MVVSLWSHFSRVPILPPWLKLVTFWSNWSAPKKMAKMAKDKKLNIKIDLEYDKTSAFLD